MDTTIAVGVLRGSATGILDLDPSVHHRPHQHHHLPHPSPPQAGVHVIPGGGLLTSDDEDEAGDVADENGHGQDASFKAGKSKKGSPWHRMKWTDEMVRLLITIVAYLGDDGTPEVNDGPAAAVRRRSGAVLQKKGKWKAVSRLMMEKGCYVSPQQCEDKFNDLNKRYKRLNEILGRGTTCMVVENPALLDSMTNVSLKAKEDVRKILSSKHLFYREMCAYHNGHRIPYSQDLDLEGCSLPKVEYLKEGNEYEDEEEGDDDENEENGDDEEKSDGFAMRSYDSFRVEIDGLIQDKSRSISEQKDWLRKRALQLQEERLEIRAEGLELEKRQFKWQRFRSKKDKEMERLRLDNERLMLENERMAMRVKQKELDLDRLRHGEPMDPAGFPMDREQGRDKMEVGMVQ